VTQPDSRHHDPESFREVLAIFQRCLTAKVRGGDFYQSEVDAAVAEIVRDGDEQTELRVFALLNMTSNLYFGVLAGLLQVRDGIEDDEEATRRAYLEALTSLEEVALAAIEEESE
jgi:hypothetical protein